MDDKLVDRLTYHVHQAKPSDWIAHRPLAFEGNRAGSFIARISGDMGGTQLHNAKLMGRHWELEGYGPSQADAIQDLLVKLEPVAAPSLAVVTAAADRMGRAIG